MGNFVLAFGIFLLVPLLGNNLTIALSLSQNLHAVHHYGMLLSRERRLNKVTERNLSESLDHCDGVDNNLIEDAYRRAQESDEDWYSMIMSDILGIEESEDDKKASSKFESFYVEREEADAVSFDQGLNSFLAGPNETLMTSANSTILGASRFTLLTRENSSNTDGGRHDTKDSSEENGDDGTSTLFPSENDIRASLSANDGMAPKGIAMLRYVDQRGLQKTIEVDVLMDFGYRLSDIKKLRSTAVEKIVKLGLRKPKRGIPKNWIVLSRGPEIDFIRKSADVKRVTNDGSRRSRSHFLKKKARQLPDSERRVEIANGKRRKINAPKQGSRDTLDSSIDDDFWMDVGTFTSYLRKEAQLRLSILGPSWSEAVKDESRWRLEMYKNWLVMINDPKREKPIRSKRSRGRRRATTEMEEVRFKRRQGKRARQR